MLRGRRLNIEISRGEPYTSKLLVRNAIDLHSWYIGAAEICNYPALIIVKSSQRLHSGPNDMNPGSVVDPNVLHLNLQLLL